MITLADIKEDILKKHLSKFIYNDRNYSLYRIQRQGEIMYNLIDEDFNGLNKLKRFDSISKALNSIGFKED